MPKKLFFLITSLAKGKSAGGDAGPIAPDMWMPLSATVTQSGRRQVAQFTRVPQVLYESQRYGS